MEFPCLRTVEEEAIARTEDERDGRHLVGLNATPAEVEEKRRKLQLSARHEAPTQESVAVMCRGCLPSAQSTDHL